ncbi:hypothetical protein E5D57_009320 [Metarhizium anisopliae]|uniref:Uncharacterized protein n=2 Tax=Metarhizium robertsii TaxID=568076 RepID=E9EKU4_METRA|nr:uncharacterized protein MAA_00953 [Metarhizium robertsii ARSEF 23]EFZ03879.1 hypothetical protein MAA_00953 [Metarhizium robertsii ARSEF 23]EXU95173.1 hypothetical protein X797_011747 [Metarhizium robertsii]KAF5128381.1 hypothetical protein E5D57_009320 [Metarhizium anisopliae]
METSEEIDEDYIGTSQDDFNLAINNGHAEDTAFHLKTLQPSTNDVIQPAVNEGTGMDKSDDHKQEGQDWDGVSKINPNKSSCLKRD